MIYWAETAKSSFFLLSPSCMFPRMRIEQGREFLFFAISTTRCPIYILLRSVILYSGFMMRVVMRKRVFSGTSSREIMLSTSLDREETGVSLRC